MNQGQKLNSLIRKRDSLQEQIAEIARNQRTVLQREIRTLDRLTTSGKRGHMPTMSLAARARQSRTAKQRWEAAKKAGKNRL